MVDSLNQLLSSPYLALVALAALVIELAFIAGRRADRWRLLPDLLLLSAPGALLIGAVFEAWTAQRGWVIAALLGGSWIVHLLDLRRRLELSGAAARSR